MEKTSYRKLLTKAANILKDANIENIEYDIKTILRDTFDIDYNKFVMDMDNEFEADKSLEYEFISRIEKRKKHIPLQYIINKQNFYGLDLYVNESVLIPRYDTENIVDCIVKDFEGSKDISVLDLCTGSGCIAISLKKHGFEKVFALDISDKALEVAKHNAYIHNADITFIKSDLYKELPNDIRFDLIVSNPPYIRTGEIEKLDDEVKDFEPKLALDGGKDGLDFYKKILNLSKDFINKNGSLYFEIGYDQAKDVVDLAKKEGYYNIKIIKDLSGKDRGISMRVD
jgi:protein-(glutamine-N5) methyltransferase, release factor-specific